jgi:hypothetical protein
VLELRLLAAATTAAGDGDAAGGGDAQLVAQGRELLSAAAERELEEMLIAQGLSFGKVGELAPRLADKLSALESETIGALVCVGPAALDLVAAAMSAQERVRDVDAWLNDHNAQLNHMLTYIAQIEAKNNRMEISSRNQMRLLDELEALRSVLALPAPIVRALESADLNTPDGVGKASKAARTLGKQLSKIAELDAWQREMAAVRERAAYFGKLRDTFATELEKHVQQLVAREGDALIDAKAARLTWRAPTALHAALRTFDALVHWLRDADAQTFALLLSAYQRVVQRANKRAAKSYFQDVHRGIKKEHADRRLAAFSDDAPPTQTSDAALRAAMQTGGGVDKISADEALVMALSTVVELVLVEQRFAGTFFALEHSAGSGTDVPRAMPEGRRVLASAPTASAMAAALRATPTAAGGARVGTTMGTAASARVDSNVDDDSPSELERFVGVLFDGVEDELRSVIEVADKADPFYVLGILVSTVCV